MKFTCRTSTEAFFRSATLTRKVPVIMVMDTTERRHNQHMPLHQGLVFVFCRLQWIFLTTRGVADGHCMAATSPGTVLSRPAACSRILMYYISATCSKRTSRRFGAALLTIISVPVYRRIANLSAPDVRTVTAKCGTPLQTRLRSFNHDHR